MVKSTFLGDSSIALTFAESEYFKTKLFVTPTGILFSLFFGFISLALFIISLIQKYNYEVFVHKNPIFIIGVATLFISLQLITIAVISFFLEEKN